MPMVKELASHRHAAAEALAALGRPDDLELVGYSTAASFVAGDVFIRVSDPGLDPAQPADTLHAAAGFAAAGVHVARPLSDQPLLIGGHWVELYERLAVTATGTDPATLGRELARLHAMTPGGNAMLPPLRRMDAAAARLAASEGRVRPALWREATRRMAQAAEICEATSGRPGLAHGDPSLTNLLATSQGPAWVDLEYAGWGKVAFDVAYLLGELRRMAPPGAAAEAEASYRSVGSMEDAAVEALGSVRDAIGVADAVALSWRSPRLEHLASFRLDTIDTPCRWDPVASVWAAP